jgi:hypothetical protein
VDDVTIGDEITRGRDDQGTKWPGTIGPGDKMTGTKWPDTKWKETNRRVTPEIWPFVDVLVVLMIPPPPPLSLSLSLSFSLSLSLSLRGMKFLLGGRIKLHQRMHRADKQAVQESKDWKKETCHNFFAWFRLLRTVTGNVAITMPSQSSDEVTHFLCL